MVADQTDASHRDSVPWTPRDAWWAAGAMVLWLLVSGASMLFARLLSLELNPGLTVTALELLLLVPVWWLAVHKYGAGWQDLGLRGFSGTALGLGCGLLILSYLFNLIYSLVLAQFNLRMQQDLMPLLSELSSPWWFLLGAVVVAPVVEEIFFRGFLFAGLRGRYGWQKAAVISSALFALVHLQPTAVLPIFLLGLIFALLYERSGSIWPAVLMHVSSNALALGAAYLALRLGLSG
jgi:membrane protease YdiL (CAAX protease family)